MSAPRGRRKGGKGGKEDIEKRREEGRKPERAPKMREEPIFVREKDDG